MYGKRRLKTSTLGSNATPFQTPHQAEAHAAESIIKPSKQRTAQKPCNNNIGSLRNMGGWRK